MFLVSDNGVSSVSPDGETVWDVDNHDGDGQSVPTAKVYACANGELLATHDLRAQGIPQESRC